MKIILAATMAGLLAIIAMPPLAQTKAPPKMTKLVLEDAQSLVTAPYMALTFNIQHEAVVPVLPLNPDPGRAIVATIATGSFRALPSNDNFAGRTLGHQALEEMVPAADIDDTGAAQRTFSSSA